MNKIFPLFFIVLFFSITKVHSAEIDTFKIKIDLENLLSDLESEYVYYNSKDVDLLCLKDYYTNEIKNLNTKTDVLLFFEYLLDEFYDSHLHLNVSNKKSYRLYSPIYVETKKDKTIITSIWEDQIENKLDIDLIGAELLTFNNITINKLIEDFPTHCNNKNNDEIRIWISNKILSGKYNESRLLRFKTIVGEIKTIDLDTIKIKIDTKTLSYSIKEDIGIIRINNSLSNVLLRKKIKSTIKELEHTKGLIIDLRNTVDGGNTSVANPLAGHFTLEKQAFQKYKNKTEDFVDYIKPNKPNYTKPLIVLVGRWTGSMGEGLANGFNAIRRAKIVGTKMLRLAGATHFNKFKNRNYGYQFPYIGVYSLSDKPRELFVPEYEVVISSDSKDDILLEGLRLLGLEINKD